jgi:hypothetical protein
MVYIAWLADAARTTGYRVVEVAGWRSRGHGAMRLVEGVVGHHTATPARAGGDYPSLNVVTNGRSDLAGPLAHLGLGRDGTVYVIAAGVGWHAGASNWDGFVDLNDEFIGIEAESPGDGTWTAAQRDCYPKLVGALLRYMNRPKERYAGHKDVCRPPGRKIDPAGIDTAWMQNTAAKYITGGGGAAPGQEDDVRPSEWNDADKKVVYETNWWGAKGARLIPDRMAGMPNAWPEGILGSINDRIIRQQLQPLRQQVTQLVNLVAQREAVSADDIAAALRAGIVADVLPVLREVLGDALGDDNAEQAEAISDAVLAKLGAKLGGA